MNKCSSQWRNKPIDIAIAPRSDSKIWTPAKVTWSEIAEWAANPADRKECGAVFYGTLRGNRRTRANVLTRTAIALDADYAPPDFTEKVRKLGYGALAHTTWNSTPERPRWRLLMPVDRPLTAGEYPVVARAIMRRIGLDYFDLTCDQPERLMLKPSRKPAP